MRWFLYVALIAALAPVSPSSHYFYYWSSPKPVNPASIVVTVEGGTLIGTHISDDHMWGFVGVDAPRECVVITWHSETESGIGMNDRIMWDLECNRVFLPSLSTTTNTPIWHP